MAEFTTCEQMAKELAKKALDEFFYEGKTIREWIKILAEKETCEDAVSRDAVIKAIDKHTFDTDDGLCLDDDISIILEDVLSVKPEPKTEGIRRDIPIQPTVPKMPSTEQEPKTEWIPVSERLPEINQRVLVTSYSRVCYAMMTSEDGNSGYPVFRLQDSLNERVVCETTVHSEFTTGRIIAWMPLPKPYQESEG